MPVDIFADPKLQDAYYSAAVLRTEAVLDDVYRKLKATHGAHPIRSFREKRSDVLYIYLYEKGDPGADSFFEASAGFAAARSQARRRTAAAT